MGFLAIFSILTLYFSLIEGLFSGLTNSTAHLYAKGLILALIASITAEVKILTV